MTCVHLTPQAPLPSTGGTVYGSEFQFSQSVVPVTTTATPSTANDITTGTLPVTYLTLTTPALPLGTYLVEVSFMFNHDNQGTDFVSRLNMDAGADLSLLHRYEPKDSAGGANPDAIILSGTDQRIAFHGRKVFGALSGAHTFDLEFATGRSGHESTIIEGNITIIRVS